MCISICIIVHPTSLHFPHEGNLDWLNYLYAKSPLASRVVSCNSMGFGCCKDYGGGKCYEYGDAPSGGDRTTAGQHLCAWLYILDQKEHTQGR